MDDNIKKILEELQSMADAQLKLKSEVEFLLKEGDQIKDKLQNSDRLFSITESINTVMNELDSLELEYDNKLTEYNKK